MYIQHTHTHTYICLQKIYYYFKYIFKQTKNISSIDYWCVFYVDSKLNIHSSHIKIALIFPLLKWVRFLTSGFPLINAKVLDLAAQSTRGWVWHSLPPKERQLCMKNRRKLHTDAPPLFSSTKKKIVIWVLEVKKTWALKCLFKRACGWVWPFLNEISSVPSWPIPQRSLQETSVLVCTPEVAGHPLQSSWRPSNIPI